MISSILVMILALIFAWHNDDQMMIAAAAIDLAAVVAVHFIYPEIPVFYTTTTNTYNLVKFQSGEYYKTSGDKIALNISDGTADNIIYVDSSIVNVFGDEDIPRAEITVKTLKWSESSNHPDGQRKYTKVVIYSPKSVVSPSKDESSSPDQLTCWNCGEEIKSDVNFCPNCGEKIDRTN